MASPTELFGWQVASKVSGYIYLFRVYDWYHRRAAPMTGSAKDRVLEPFDFGGSRRRGYFPHLGLVIRSVRCSVWDTGLHWTAAVHVASGVGVSVRPSVSDGCCASLR